MWYITERITNIAELEKILQECRIMSQILQKKCNDECAQSLTKKLNEAIKFEFKIERRKTTYCE